MCHGVTEVMGEYDRQGTFNSLNEESKIYSYHLVLLSDADEIYELWLPKTAEGFFQFADVAQCRFLNVVAKDGKWYAVCRKPAFFKEVPISNSYEMNLGDGELLKISIDEREYLLLIEKVLPQRNVFHNYNIVPGAEIVIGNQPECDIYYRGPYVSRKHAAISRINGQWQIRSYNDMYGIYVNGEKVDFSYLKLGDVVFIMGLKIIIGHSFLSINNGLGEVVVNSRVIQDDTVARTGHYHYYNESNSNDADKFFNRAPRKRREMEEKVITVEGPPMSMSQKQMPLMLRMGSSMVMGGAAALAGNFMTLISSVLFPFLSSKYTDNQRNEYEKLRKTKYTEYLQKKQNEIIDAINYEQVALNQKFPHMYNATEQNQLMRHLWERRPCDSDFLQLRVGTGKRPLSAKIDYPSRGFSLDADYLEEQMYQLVEKEYTVENVPIVLSLMDTYVCGIQGQRQRVIDFIESLILQIAMFHSYDEVKMVFLVDESDLEQLDAVRYLPHAWDDMRSTRFVATNEAEAYSVGEYIKAQVDAEKSDRKDVQQILKHRPYYVVFALDKKTFDGHEFFKEILADDTNKGVSVITAFDSLIKESQKIITLQNTNTNICTTMGVDGGDDEMFAVDTIPSQQIKQAMRTISNVSLKKITQAQAMPKMVTFMEMFSAGRIEQLNPLKRWRENNPIKSLATPVGVGEDGSLFMLDLHEKRQGPHGLVAGMTGSGKSEFLITYILSMAVNYHPDEVAFVLIDYKGGGLASAFDNPKTGVKLPHLVGTITNLDGASINRSLSSIESELLRRQRVFNEVSTNLNEGTMNIYTYQKLYRAGKVDKPMPHLFIVSDEFAELKQQQPEFMEKLISAARIGRSLGVHLILATQKPSGVVNDQIRSNTKFRVCLRVQDRSDSMDMLKRHEGAELKDTGRFYLQVGYNEYFALGQSAWCGAQYEPQDRVIAKKDDFIEFIDVIGQVVTKTNPKVIKNDSGMKQIVAVVNYLNEIACNANINVKQLWEKPLPSILDFNEIKKEEIVDEESTRVCLGRIDDPKQQKQYPLYLDLQSFHHMLLCGQAGSGKSTFFKSMLYSIVMEYEPDDVNFYILDLSGGMLSIYKNMPHCGAYLSSDDETDFDRLLAMIQEITEERKKLFTEAEVFGYDAYRKINRLPLILVIIDGWTNIINFTKGQEYSLTISRYMREAANYGIKFIFSVNSYNEVSAKVKQELDYKIVLQAKDKFDYNDILNIRNAFVPTELPGRGICVIDGCPLEYQIAVPFSNLEEQKQTTMLKEAFKERSEQLHQCKIAKRLPMINSELEYDDFCSCFEEERIPLGFSMQNMNEVSIPLQQLYTVGLYFGNPIGVKPIVYNWLSAFKRENSDVIIVRRRSGTIFDKRAEESLQNYFLGRCRILDINKDSLNELDSMIIDNIQQTKKAYRDEFCTLNGIPETDMGRTQKAAKHIRKNSNPLVVLFESFSDLITTEMDSTLQAEYSALFSQIKGYNVYFIGCFYPEDENHSVDSMFRSFNKNDFSLLFGGQFHKQWITSIATEYRKMEKINPNYNRFVMKYHNDSYKMIMPCGQLITSNGDPDEEEII